ncbi:MAG: hypothetical protein LQ337_006999 [Flavoplaca oasis]|nr:MAG: hypothetical protein LQ337_006999 [Flavoplaca oasis]
MPVFARGQIHYSEEEIAHLTPEIREYWRYRARAMQASQQLSNPNNMSGLYQVMFDEGRRLTTGDLFVCQMWFDLTVVLRTAPGAMPNPVDSFTLQDPWVEFLSLLGMDERHIPLMNQAAAYGDILATISDELGAACLWFLADVYGGAFLLATPKTDVEIREAISQLRMLEIDAKVAGFEIVGAAENIRLAQVRNLKKALARAAIERAMKIF